MYSCLQLRTTQCVTTTHEENQFQKLNMQLFQNIDT